MSAKLSELQEKLEQISKETMKKAWSPEAREAAAEARKRSGGSDEHGRWTAEQHASELKDAIHDNPRFDAAIERLKADRGMTPEHAKQIANSFLGYTPSVRSKTGLIGEITQRQRIEQRQRARGREIDKMKEW